MGMTIELTPEIERQLWDEAAREGRDVGELARAMLEAQLALTREERNRGAAELVEQWLSEPPNEEDDRWPELMEALERNRAGQRSLFGA